MKISSTSLEDVQFSKSSEERADPPIKTNGWKTSIERHKSIWSKDYQLPPPLPPKKDPREVSHPTTKGKTAVQHITTLTAKIAALPPKPDIDEEMSKLHESYGINKGLITTKICETEKEIINSNEDDIFKEILKTPEKTQKDNSNECTIDDIFGVAGSPILDGKVWRNPFSSSAKQKKESQMKKPGGALDRFSKLRRTIVEEACIVQSRYFGAPASELKPSVKKDISLNMDSSDLATSLEDIMAGSSSQNTETAEATVINKKHLSPEKNSFTITNMTGVAKGDKNRSLLCSPNKSAFSITNITDNDSLNRTRIESPSKKNIFSVSSLNDCQTTATTSPKPQSFLSIIDSISKNAPDNEKKNEKPIKKLSSPSFKWQQPLLDFTFKKNPSKLETVGDTKKGNETFYKPCTSQGPRLKSPQNKLNYSPKGKSPTIKKRTGSLLEKNNLKKRSTDTGIAQPSIFEMFAFQPKPKLKIQ